MTKYKGAKFLVVEGNRRLAALRLILDGKTDFKAGKVSDLHKIPALLLKEPYEAVSVDQWLIQGTRHIGGVKEWGPYQKARALQTLLRNKGLNSKEAAAALGLTAYEANRSLRSLSAFESVEADPRFGEKLKPADFSSFEEMLNRPILRNYFGWSNSRLQFINDKKREFFLHLILGDPESDRPPKIHADIDLRKVPQILKYSEALRSFEDLSQPFEQAVYLSQISEKQARISASLDALESWARSLLDALQKPTQAQRETAQKVRDHMDAILRRPR